MGIEKVLKCKRWAPLWVFFIGAWEGRSGTRDDTAGRFLTVISFRWPAKRKDPVPSATAWRSHYMQWRFAGCVFCLCEQISIACNGWYVKGRGSLSRRLSDDSVLGINKFSNEMAATVFLSIFHSAANSLLFCWWLKDAHDCRFASLTFHFFIKMKLLSALVVGDDVKRK